MKYNFDIAIDRSQNNAAKFSEMYLHFNSDTAMPLWLADMDFATAPEIVEAIKIRADQGIFGYTNRPDEYFESYADWQERRNGWKVDVNLMAFASGVVPAIITLIEQLTQTGDKIMIQPPVYHPFTDAVVGFGRTLITNELIKDNNGQYKIDFDDFENKLKCGVKCFILCNPHNPVGRVWTREELSKMARLCIKHGVQIISDEIHSDLTLFGFRHTPLASIAKEIKDITITCNAPSKTFNLAGLQSATIIFPNEMKKNIYVENIRKRDMARNNCFSIVATIAAYTKGDAWLEQLKEYLESNMRFVKDYLGASIPQIKTYLPEATYLMWIDFHGLHMPSEELQPFLVHNAGLALNDGSLFGSGGQGYARMNVACPRRTLQKALQQLKEAVGQYRH